MTAHPALPVARPVTGVACLDWLQPAVEIAAPVSKHWPPGGWAWTRRARVATRTPDLEPGSVRVAREFAGMTVRRWGMAEFGDDVGVVMSELLTNALRHAVPPTVPHPAPSPVRVGLLSAGSYLMCAVADPSDQVPVLKEPDYLAESGRGLHVVASLADRWGWTAPDRTGKVVWATFRH